MHSVRFLLVNACQYSKIANKIYFSHCVKIAVVKIRLHNTTGSTISSEPKVADDCLSTNILAAEAKPINNEGGQAYVCEWQSQAQEGASTLKAKKCKLKFALHLQNT